MPLVGSGVLYDHNVCEIDFLGGVSHSTYTHMSFHMGYVFNQKRWNNSTGMYTVLCVQLMYHFLLIPRRTTHLVLYIMLCMFNIL